MIIDFSRDSLITNFGLETLKDRYMIPGETSPQQVFARAAKAFSDNEEHAQRMYDYASKLWLMFSTPILSNGGLARGLGISCFLSEIADSRDALTDHWTENMFLASMGGGIGTSYSNLRSTGTPTSKGSMSNGIIPFLKVADAEIQAVSQGVVRRGSYAAYLHISHPEIEEFILVRKPTGGDENRKALNIHNAVVIPDSFMEAVEKGQNWDLIDPHSKEVKKTIKARDLWQSLLETRMSTGEPYFMFEDTVNDNSPKEYKKLGYKITTSNLCQEVLLTTSPDRTAVCCLSSVNLEYYDDWKDNELFIEDLVRFLDNVLSHFIINAPKEMWRAKYAAEQERSIGIGATGFHYYLQKNNIPFEGPIASGINRGMFHNIKTKAVKATRLLAKEKGPAPDSTLEDPVRNINLMSVAPNANLSIISNSSPSIEPVRANAFTHKTLSGSFLVKNKYLIKLLDSKNKNSDEIWSDIIINDGSVQHLDFLTDWEKDVFKTAIELDQHWIIQHASDRQPDICQGQSINVFFPPDVNIQYLHDVHFAAWKKKLKGLYYCRSQSIKSADKISQKIERIIREDLSECLSCEG